MRSWRIAVILLIFVISSGFFFLGDHLVYERRVVGPLLADLRALPGVEQAAIEGRGDAMRVLVTPGDEVEILALYTSLAEVTRKHLGAHSEELIELVDTRTPLLEKAYQQMRFAVEEAVATGRFTQLTASVGHTAELYGLDGHAIYIDAERIYLELEDDLDRLLAVIPRERGTAYSHQG